MEWFFRCYIFAQINSLQFTRNASVERRASMSCGKCLDRYSMQQVRWVEANMLSVSFCYQSAAHLHAAPPAPAEAVEELAPSGSNWRHLETDRDRSAMD